MRISRHYLLAEMAPKSWRWGTCSMFLYIYIFLCTCISRRLAPGAMRDEYYYDIPERTSTTIKQQLMHETRKNNYWQYNYLCPLSPVAEWSVFVSLNASANRWLGNCFQAPHMTSVIK